MVRPTLVATAVLLALGCAACSGSDSPGADDGSPSVAPSGSATPRSVVTPDARHVVAKGVPSASASAAARTIGEAMAGINDALATPDKAASTLRSDLVSGAAREAVLAQAAEYADSGWQVSGEPRIVRMIVRPHGKQLRVRACVDQSAVVVTDAAGQKLPRGTTSDRSWLVLTLAPADQGWQVVDQTFPDDPDC